MGPSFRTRIAAELLDGEFEGHAGAQRGLFEQQTEVAAGQRLGEPRGHRLHLLGKVEQRQQFFLRKVEIAREVAGPNFGKGLGGRHLLDRLERCTEGRGHFLAKSPQAPNECLFT